MQPLAAHATPSALHQRLLRAVCHRLDSVTAQGCTLALALLSARPEYNAKFSVGERVKAAPRHQLQHAGAPVNCRAEDTGSRVFGAASAKALLPLAPAHLLPPANAPPRSEPHGACRVHRWALSPGLVVCTLQAVACGRNASAAHHACDHQAPMRRCRRCCTWLQAAPYPLATPHIPSNPTLLCTDFLAAPFLRFGPEVSLDQARMPACPLRCAPGERPPARQPIVVVPTHPRGATGGRGR